MYRAEDVGGGGGGGAPIDSVVVPPVMMAYNQLIFRDELLKTS